MFEKGDLSNIQKMNGCSFQQVLWKKLSWFFSQHRKRVVLEISFKSQQKQDKSFYKTILVIFKITLCLGNQHVFIGQSLEILNAFNSLSLKQVFWKRKTFFKNLEYLFLVESTEIENATFPYTKRTRHKEQSFESNYFIILKVLFEFKNYL